MQFEVILIYQGPILLGCDAPETGISPQPWRELPRHRDEDQVKLDVNRSFIYYPDSKYSTCLLRSRAPYQCGTDESEKQLDRRKEELSDVITETLRRHPMLCYFQGFHDIAQVFLLVLGVENAADAVAHLSLLRIRDFMLPSLSPSLAHLRLLPAILYSTDAKLCQHLSQTQPFFALAATLTLYAHDIQEYGDIARLFDFLLAQEAVVSVYLFAVIILSRREELFKIPADEPEMLHSVLSKLPKPLDLEALISRTMHLFSAHSPPGLPFRAWGKVSIYSVLKTTRRSLKEQTLRDGEEFFEMQALQLRRAELRQHALATLWKYRRPAGSIGLAVFIGIMSFWFRKSGMDGVLGSGLRRVWELFRMVRAR